jgi:sarcosine oxidase subunit beta
VAQRLGCDLGLVPQRHQACVVHLPRELSYTMPSVMDYTPGSGARGLYFRHEGPGRLIAGLHGEEASDSVADPDLYARQADQEFLEALARKLSGRLPGLADAALAGGWAGLYPVSVTGRPLVGPLSSDAAVIVAGGAGGSGIQLSPVLGELAADWVLHGEPRAVAGARQLAPV